MSDDGKATLTKLQKGRESGKGDRFTADECAEILMILAALGDAVQHERMHILATVDGRVHATHDVGVGNEMTDVFAEDLAKHIISRMPPAHREKVEAFRAAARAAGDAMAGTRRA